MSEGLTAQERAALRMVLLCVLGIAALAPLWKITNGWTLVPSLVLAAGALVGAVRLHRAQVAAPPAEPAPPRDTE